MTKYIIDPRLVGLKHAYKTPITEDEYNDLLSDDAEMYLTEEEALELDLIDQSDLDFDFTPWDEGGESFL